MRTTPDRMRTAFKQFRFRPDYRIEDLWGGPVQYVGLTQIRMRGAGMLERFFFRHCAFEWNGNSGSRSRFEWLRNSLFKVIGSTITDEERATVGECVKAAGLTDRLKVSTLLGRPRYA
ncbi:Uncharacterized protein MLTONO_3161 [Mesorhizobium loti]|nr:Uncharacterized protein MLTONO_3161 [Mesorhizobium loti]